MAKEDEKPAEAEAEGASEAQESPKKKLPLKFVLIGVVALLVVVGGGGGAAMMLMGGGAKGKAHHAHKKTAENGKDGKSGPISEGPDGVLFYTMPDMVVNIQSTDGRPTYLKLKLAFEVADQDSADAIGPNAPRLNDMFQSFLRELRPEDLSGSDGSYQLRMEILRRVNMVIAPAKVNAVLIQEMLVQ